MNRIRTKKTRKGMSFIEVIVALTCIAMMMGMMVASVAVMRSNMQNAIVYADMRAYAINKFEVLQMNLENGIQIDAENYNDAGDESNIRADVYVTDIGYVHGKPTYYIYMELYHLEAGNVIRTSAVLREGCIAYAS